MSTTDLNIEFINILQDQVPKRAELVRLIADTLRIEKESASRRLNGSVMFSVREVGILARHMHISLDRLISPDNSYEWLPTIMKSSQEEKSIEWFYEFLQSSLKKVAFLASDDWEYGAVFNYLPVEIYMRYERLTKFMFFKWGHYFVGSGEFYDFDAWELPEAVKDMKSQCEKAYADISKVVYIWDDLLVWELTREIENFFSMGVISLEECEKLGEELLTLFQDVEVYAKHSAFEPYNHADLSLYVSNTPLGMNAWYQHSDRGALSMMWTNFMWSPITDNYQTSLSLKKWIMSLLKISSLVSGSGPRERRLFFMEQRKIVENMLKRQSEMHTAMLR